MIHRIPGNSFLIDNTGKFFNSEFGAFVYGPKTNTNFLSVIPKSNWIQINNEKNSSNNLGLVVTSRGSYGYILNTIIRYIIKRSNNKSDS